MLLMGKRSLLLLDEKRRERYLWFQELQDGLTALYWIALEVERPDMKELVQKMFPPLNKLQREER